MQNNLVIKFETQMKSIITEIVFASDELWKDHLIYMLHNIDQLWINILSAFVNRDHPRRVLRLSQWQEELGNIKPIIHKGLTSVPFLVHGKNNQPDCIVHDAWDIGDLQSGDEYIVSCQLYKQMKNMNSRYGLQHEESFWDSFIFDAVMDNLFFSNLLSDHNFKVFIVSSLKYLILGEGNIDMSYVCHQQGEILCEIYKHIYAVIISLDQKYIEYANKLGRELEKEKQFKIALARSERMLPERLRDAERKIKQNQISSAYDPEDSKERSKFENV